MNNDKLLNNSKLKFQMKKTMGVFRRMVLMFYLVRESINDLEFNILNYK